MIENKPTPPKREYPDSKFYTERTFLKGEDRPVSRQTESFERELVEDWDFVFSFYHTSSCPDKYKDDTYLVRIKKGQTYYPSIPQLFYWLISPRRIMVPSMVHDVMYRYQGGAIDSDNLKVCRLLGEGPPRQDDVWQEVKVDRSFAEMLFRLMMGTCKVSVWKKAIAYHVVNTFGWFLWENWNNWILDKFR